MPWVFKGIRHSKDVLGLSVTVTVHLLLVSPLDAPCQRSPETEMTANWSGPGLAESLEALSSRSRQASLPTRCLSRNYCVDPSLTKPAISPLPRRVPGVAVAHGARRVGAAAS